MKEDQNRPEIEIAEEFWEGFLARNQSIIVDLMYGQLKSTVTCLTCNERFLSFDPFLMIQLPITRQNIIEFGFVKYEIYEQNEPAPITLVKIVPDNTATIKEIKVMLM